MKNYDEIKKLWDDFKEEIKYKNRYFVGKEIVEILDRFYDKRSSKRNRMVGFRSSSLESCVFYRARIGNFKDKKDSEILAPPLGKASSGRCNPEGISYLYLATNENTAICEVKPNKGDIVTVAKIFYENYDVFNFSIYRSENELIKEFLGVHDDELMYLIEIIDKDLKSVITIDEKNEYLPCQFIAEYVKSKGFNGFSYSSTLSVGKNYVFFEWSEHIEIHEKYLKKIKNVKYDIEDVE